MEEYTISELAGEFGITTRTIRYYEEMELLHSHRESIHHQRLYDDRDRVRLKLILRGKRLGFSLGEIKNLLDLYDADPTQREQLIQAVAYGDKKIKEIDEKISELQATKEELLEFRERFLELLREGDK
ncbi:MerR family transcriptional regulator [Dethiobacter alkaliphilus]|uniref:Transcriptional regulator, MerR family n=1 Tax=Dethiobacter alkaliphilus AHT 1 TaxID=555088 RepID=C0GGY1_DETAL|nr:MerR family DNA-binding transcriptional regulator [Dethiobacter alkaliphilus]EEG77283.1 transcriptional regulator, MerR family [Dethiobacter alkaliphilus AHT 1]MCW3490167.1 MerR family DNA-binding transcriptional regulator [Dethiobacter alkaliphilus]